MDTTLDLRAACAAIDAESQARLVARAYLNGWPCVVRGEPCRVVDVAAGKVQVVAVSGREPWCDFDMMQKTDKLWVYPWQVTVNAPAEMPDDDCTCTPDSQPCGACRRYQQERAALDELEA